MAVRLGRGRIAPGPAWPRIDRLWHTEGMSGILELAGAVVAYFVVMRWLLPRLGVPT